MSTSWIVPCNVNYFDIIGVFKRQRLLNYKQSTNIEIGDTVYIYLSIPHQEIRYKCLVLEVNKPKCYIDDDDFVINGKNYLDCGRFMTLYLEREYDNHELPLNLLSNLGIKGVIQSPMRINDIANKTISSI